MLCLSLLALGTVSEPQAVPERTLPAVGAEFPEGFTRIASIRELRDGRVLVVDERDATVRLLDFTRGTMSDVGRQGGGPGEYRSPSRLLPMPGDSTLLTDIRQQRSIVIGPDGKAGDLLLSGTALADAPSQARAPLALDPRGRLYFQQLSIDPNDPTTLPDSAWLVRWSPTTRKSDTVGRVKIPWRDIQIQRENGKVSKVAVFTVPLMPQDDWTMLRDGRIAVIRTGDYHLELIGPDGAITRGARIPYTPIEITAAERRQGPLWEKSPKLKPPFDGPSILAAPDDRLWIKRTTVFGDSTARYDVLDLGGRLVARVALPARTRLAGFGAASLYVVRRDLDDVEYLGRLVQPKL